MNPGFLLAVDFAGTFGGIVENVIEFFPRLIWSLFVLGVGVGVAIFAAGRIQEAWTASEVLADRYAGLAAGAVKVALYFFAATIALAELGVQTAVLVTFVDGLAFGIGLALALLIGALVWNSREYVADNVEDWVDSATGDGTDGAAEAEASPADDD